MNKFIKKAPEPLRDVPAPVPPVTDPGPVLDESRPMTLEYTPIGQTLPPISETDPDEERESGPTTSERVLSGAKHLRNVFGGLALGGMAFYLLADYTSATAGETSLGQVVLANSITQLFSAGYRLAFILAGSLGLLRLIWPELWNFFRPGTASGPDLDYTLRHEITPFQRLCVFLAVFFALCFLFVLLLSVNLPESVSVGR